MEECLRARNTERCQVIAIPWADRRADFLERPDMSTPRWSPDIDALAALDASGTQRISAEPKPAG